MSNDVLARPLDDPALEEKVVELRKQINQVRRRVVGVDAMVT